MQLSKEMFKKKLVEFFERHDPDKILLAPKIAEEFINHQDRVFQHLTKIYEKDQGNRITEESLLSLIPPADEGAEPI